MQQAQLMNGAENGEDPEEEKKEPNSSGKPKAENDSDFEDLLDDDNEVKPAATIKPPTTTNSSTSKRPVSDLPSLGTIEGLRTENPVFKIPFADKQQYLVFPGKKTQDMTQDSANGESAVSRIAQMC